MDITNYVMFDLNRPLHAYDADKINKEIIVRNAKEGEVFEALDNRKYKLKKGMCVISDKSGVQEKGLLEEPLLLYRIRYKKYTFRSCLF